MPEESQEPSRGREREIEQEVGVWSHVIRERLLLGRKTLPDQTHTHTQHHNYTNNYIHTNKTANEALTRYLKVGQLEQYFTSFVNE